MAVDRAKTNALDFEALKSTIQKMAVERPYREEELETLAWRLVQDLCPEKVSQDSMIDVLVAAAKEAIAASDAA